MGRKCFLFLVLLLICLPLSITSAAEEVFPNRPISIVISMAPGGLLDTHAKIIGDRLAEVLGQPVLRINKAGGGGVLGASFSARAKPDGYTLFLGTSTGIVFAPITKNVDYSLDDFIPLGIYNKGAVYFGVKSNSKWKTVKDFVDDAKQRPGQLRGGTFGKLTHSDFVIQLFSKLAGIKLAVVPYKSCSETVTSLLGGHTDADFCTSFMGQVDAGAVRILAIADHERWEIQPDVKTFGEVGYPVALPLWYSFCAPQKTPKKVVDILANGLQEVYRRHGKEIRQELKRLEGQGTFLTMQQSIEAFKKDHETTFKIAKDLGFEKEK